MGNCRLNAWFAKLKLKALTKSATNHKISETPVHDKQPQPQPTSSTTTSSFASSSSASSSSSSSSCGAVPAMSFNKTGQLPYFSHKRKSYYFTRDLITHPPPPPTATLYLYDDNASTSATRCPKNYPLSQPPSPRETSLSKKKRVAVGRRNRSSIIKSQHKPSPRLVSTSVLSGCKASATIESLWTKPPDLSRQVYPPNSAAETSSDDESMLPEICSSLSLSPETLDDSVLSRSSVSSCRCRVGKKDALINAENNARPLTSKLNDKPPPKQQLDGFAGSASKFRLPQIRTNITRKSCSTGEEYIKGRANMEEASEQRGVGVGVMVKGEDMLSTNSYDVVSLSSGKVGERRTSAGATRRFSSVNNSAGGGGGGGGVKLRTNSPRIAANRRTLNQGGKRLRSSSRGRRSVSESLAVVKSSKDPQRDFRASMAEMIVENQICGAKELEDLLACYLCLNSNEYHELIIGVFKQIWFDLVEHCN